jgi:hypothetical protein
MSSKKRRILLLLALAILLISLAMLIYALQPIQSVREVIPITPTFLFPPVGKP